MREQHLQIQASFQSHAAYGVLLTVYLKQSLIGVEGSTHKLQHVPVKDVVIGEALSVEKVPEELPQIRVVWLVIKPQGATQV